MIFRTERQKRDLEAGWRRFDRSFFASGACHILTHEFLKRGEFKDFHPYSIVPESDFRGSHVFASDGILVFDYHGWSDYSNFMDHYFQKIKRIFPGWRGGLFDISQHFWSEKWFTDTCSRRPHQYYIDPTERANAFIELYIQRMPNKSASL